MLNLGFTEILFILVLAIVVVGPERLPTVMRYLGRQYARVVRTTQELKQAFLLEADRMEAKRRLDEIRRARDEILAEVREADPLATPTAPAPAAPPPPDDEPALTRLDEEPPAGPAAEAASRPADAGEAETR